MLEALFDRQKEALEADYEKEGVDVFVASFTAGRRPDGSSVSYGVRGEGVETLLPEAEKLAIMREGGAMAAIGTFERVKEIAGDPPEDAGMCPPRWRTRGFPSMEQIERIGIGQM
ncbi:hypothetical protein [Paludisphaera soli]|uniref:hypothetical protein n=1 Tax=Paludisphaera soli TaxID=2712865 RepID=UPI0013ECBA5D|nr:hypothetical protein [Paludisphaera soli]